MADHAAPEQPGLIRRLLHPAIDDEPPADQLADERDDLDWDIERDGRMAEHATDDEPRTKPWGD